MLYTRRYREVEDRNTLTEHFANDRALIFLLDSLNRNSNAERILPYIQNT